MAATLWRHMVIKSDNDPGLTTMSVVTQSWIIVTLTIGCGKITNLRQHSELIDFEEMSQQSRQRSRGIEGNVCLLRGFWVHCGRWKARYVSGFFSFSKVCRKFLKRCCLNMSQFSKCGSTWPNKWLWQMLSRCRSIHSSGDVYKTWVGVHGPGPWTTPNFQKKIAPVNMKIYLRSGYEKQRLVFIA